MTLHLGYRSGPQPVLPFSHWLGDVGVRRPTLVMIEDDLAIAQMYRMQLVMDGYQVLLATDGAAGLKLIDESRPDLVLLDIRLPRMQGLDVLRSVQASDETATIPVLILSNYGEPGMVHEGLRLGARDYLIKSQTTPVQLSMRVRELVPPQLAD
ncbi:MAG: response regulator [Candidatus Dormibacteraeota bacterium]|nr:response regulator [Candidatus Dormibacteraeota bacterium]